MQTVGAPVVAAKSYDPSNQRCPDDYVIEGDVLDYVGEQHFEGFIEIEKNQDDDKH